MRKNLEPSNPAVLNPKQLEAEFGISISQQNRLRMQKNKENGGIYALPFFKIGNKILYRREAIMEWFSKLQDKEFINQQAE